MSYDVQYSGLTVTRSGAGMDTAANLAAAAADWGIMKVHQPIQIKRFSFFVTTAVLAGTLAPQVQIVSRPTTGSSSGQIVLGTLTIPTGTAAGIVIFKELESVRVQAGYDLAIIVSRQATDGGTAAGAGFGGAIILIDPDVPANQSKMLASA